MTAPDYRLLVCGGRDYSDEMVVHAWLSLFRAGWGSFHLIVGYDPRNARFQGADQLAYQWAKARGVIGSCYPAKWEEHGRAAGPIRNRLMLERGQPDVVAAFPGGTGTANMVAQADAAGVEVIPVVVKPAKQALSDWAA